MQFRHYSHDANVNDLECTGWSQQFIDQNFWSKNFFLKHDKYPNLTLFRENLTYFMIMHFFRCQNFTKNNFQFNTTQWFKMSAQFYNIKRKHNKNGVKWQFLQFRDQRGVHQQEFVLCNKTKSQLASITAPFIYIIVFYWMFITI